jgi:outer membrane putative beta-barrel porin/alpha-amylase
MSMLKRVSLGLWFLILLTAGSAMGQGLCPLNGTLSRNLICLIPQVYGPLGLSTGGPLLGAFHSGHFESDFLSTFKPISVAVGTQLSSLPKASPSSGITFVYDPALKTFTPATEQTLGPILGERADTIGRNRLYVGFSYQYFNFDTIDGRDLSNVPAVYQHLAFPPPFPSGIVSCPNQDGLTGAYANNPCFVRDFIQTTNSIDLTVHQYTFYVTYGITRHLDVSAAIPILNVRMNVRSDTTIVQNSFAPSILGLPGNAFHQFDPTKVPSCAAASPCFDATFSDSGSASGIGDVVFRGKYQVYKGEHAGFALGVDVRTPTGDEKNYLGSGATGVKPFGVFSYSARVSPHVDLGYEVNGDSILAGEFVGPTATNKAESLPNRFIYVVGADASIIKRLTAAIDLYGQHLIDSPRLVSSQFTDFGKCSDVNCTPPLTPGTTHPNVVGAITGSNLVDLSLGFKVQAFTKLVITGNVLIKLNDDGLRAKAVPLVGVGYSF